MMQTMKQENTNPKGQASVDWAESSIGVHRKTKMYIMDSNMDCTSPNKNIAESLNIVRRPSTNERPKPNWRLPIFGKQRK